MSSLLERAIIDATALKDAALKSAEKLVIEKYSKEVKTAVDTLLSGHIEGQAIQEQDLGGLDFAEDPAAPADPLAMEPTGDVDPLAADPLAADTEEDTETLNPEDLLAKAPSAFNTDDDQVIRIKLDSLDAEMEEEPDDTRFGGGEELEDDHLGIDIVDDEIDTTDIEADVDTSGFDSEIGVDITADMVSEILDQISTEDDDEEIDLDEILERVRVDFEPQKSGWAGTPEPHMKEYESMLLAKEQDTETKEENEELRKNVAALQKENKTLSSAATKLQKQNKNYETTFRTLQEKLETMNVSNAKLLYINQALENASLNERQKRKIVEAISKADTVQEAKIIFDMMHDTVVSNLDAKKETTLNEVVSRKSSLLVAARKEQKTSNANPIYNRMQKLAGIKTE